MTSRRRSSDLLISSKAPCGDSLGAYCSVTSIAFSRITGHIVSTIRTLSTAAHRPQTPRRCRHICALADEWRRGPNGVETARTVETDARRLVPIDAVGLDDVIDHPPLRTLAPRHRPANRRGLRNGRRWGVERLERLRAVVAARVADCGKLR
jgi:hypothetical protein